jgi:protein-S-isoprenylcysteine O-methyltransferase Ste14
MRVFNKKLTSPGIDALVMFLVGVSLADYSAVAYVVNRWFGFAVAIVALGFFVVAWKCLRRRHAELGDPPRKHV